MKNHKLITHHSLLLCSNLKIEFEWTFFFHFDLMVALAIPIGGNFGLRRRRQGVAWHKSWRQRRRGDKIGDRHLILANYNAFVRWNRIVAMDNSSTALQAAFE